MSRPFLVFGVALTGLSACAGPAEHPPARSTPPASEAMSALTLADTMVASWVDASGVADPLRTSTLSTKLMGTVMAVLVQEGDRVRAGQPLVRVDARDLLAREEQVNAGIAGAEAAHREATLNATRMRSLFTDSAASRAQLDAAEAMLARSESGVRSARAGAAELGAIREYAVIRAPYAGVITQRFVDPGAFAAPGAPLLVVQDQRQLRISAAVDPTMARGLKRGDRMSAVVEGTPAEGRVEAVVPSTVPGMHTINVLVDNAAGALASGGAATVQIRQASRRVILVPVHALRRQGDLTGVEVGGPGAAGGVRWVRTGATHGKQIEVLSGLQAGETIRVPVTGGQ